MPRDIVSPCCQLFQSVLLWFEDSEAREVWTEWDQRWQPSKEQLNWWLNNNKYKSSVEGTTGEAAGWRWVIRRNLRARRSATPGTDRSWSGPQWGSPYTGTPGVLARLVEPREGRGVYSVFQSTNETYCSSSLLLILSHGGSWPRLFLLAVRISRGLSETLCSKHSAVLVSPKWSFSTSTPSSMNW